MINYGFFGNDLLQFAGMAMVLMGIFLHFKFSEVRIAWIGIVMNLVAQLIGDVDLGERWLNILLGHFIGTVDDSGYLMSDFPIFYWFMMYAIGYLVGYGYIRLKDKHLMYKKITIPVSIVTVVILIWEFNAEIGMMGGPGANVYYHANFMDMFICLHTILMSFGIAHFVIVRMLPRPIGFMALRISNLITPVFFIQWILVSWVADVLFVVKFGTPYVGVIPTLAVGVVLSVLSMYLADKWMYFYSIVSKRRKDAKN
jgi:hypothetical protein